MQGGGDLDRPHFVGRQVEALGYKTCGRGHALGVAADVGVAQLEQPGEDTDGVHEIRVESLVECLEGVTLRLDFGCALGDALLQAPVELRQLAVFGLQLGR